MRKKYITEFDIKADIDAYFASCDEDEIIVGVEGLALALGMTRKTLKLYADGEFGDTVTEAIQKIRSVWEVKLGGGSSSGAVFWLKNNAEYRDKIEHDVKSSDDGTGISASLQLAIEEALKNTFM